MKGLVLTYLLAYGGAVVALFQPVIGLFVYALFSVVRPQQMFGWAGDLTGMSTWPAMAMLAGWVFKGFGNWQFGRARAIVWLLLLSLGWMVVSSMFASNQTVAWAAVTERLKVVLAFMVGITLIDSEDWVKRLAWMLVLGQGYIAAEMNWSYVVDGFNRVQTAGYFGDNNSFAIAMVCTVGPALFLGFSAKHWWLKGLAFASAALCMHTVLLTFSRGGLLGLIVTAVMVVLLMPKRPAYLLGVVVITLLAVRFTGPEVWARFMTTFDENRDYSSQSRLDLWADCVVVMQKYPFVGVGPRHFGLIADEFGWPEGKEAHSLWLQTGAEQGIPGLMLMAGFYVVAGWYSLRLARESRDTTRSVYGLAVFSGLVGFAAPAQFVTLEGLELPIYLVLISAALLKLEPARQSAPVALPAAAPVPQRGATGSQAPVSFEPWRTR